MLYSYEMVLAMASKRLVDDETKLRNTSSLKVFRKRF